MSIRIVLSAEESAGSQTLKLIHGMQEDITLVAVLTGRPVANSVSAVEGLATRLGYPVLPAHKVKDVEFATWLMNQQIDIFLNIHSLYVICEEVLEAPRLGSFNLHPGRLPEYAGLNAPSWAIFNGEENHAVSLHRIQKSIDSGNVLYEKEIPISKSETGLSLSLSCIREGVALVKNMLEDLVKKELPSGRVQKPAERNYYLKNQIPGEGLINWNDSGEKIHAFIRAADYAPMSSPWGSPLSKLSGQNWFITKTALTDTGAELLPGTITIKNGTVFVATNDVLLEILYTKTDEQNIDSINLVSHGGQRFDTTAGW